MVTGKEPLKRRLQPSVAATDPDVKAPDASTSLVGRSVWNSNWMLIIPGISLTNGDPAEGIETFINAVSDIEIKIDAIRYNLSAANRSAEGDETSASSAKRDRANSGSGKETVKETGREQGPKPLIVVPRARSDLLGVGGDRTVAPEALETVE